MPSLARSTALMCTVLAAAACSSTGRQMGGVQNDDAVTVVVENQNVLDVSIIAFNGGRRDRLGTVRTGATETYTLSGARLFVNLRLQANPIGNPESFETPEIAVTPGNRVTFTVSSNLRNSFYSVR